MKTPKAIPAERLGENKTRSVTMPAALWAALDAEAKENRRSSQKHLETILLHLYRPDVRFELNTEAVDLAHHRAAGEPKRRAG